MLRCVLEVLLVVLVLSEGELVTPEAEAGDIERAETEIYDDALVVGVSSVSDGGETVKESTEERFRYVGIKNKSAGMASAGMAYGWMQLIHLAGFRSLSSTPTTKNTCVCVSCDFGRTHLEVTSKCWKKLRWIFVPETIAFAWF